MMQIRAEQIKKEFYRKSKGTNIFAAVNTCDFTMEEGTLTVIKGRSGGGKSTLMNMLSGILQPTEGKILYGDVDIYSMKDKELSEYRNRHIGYVPQGKSAIVSLSVIENIMLPEILYGESNEDGAVELMDKFGIAHLRDAMPEELSGGELRRMAIARALIRKPEVLFADEPTGDLDDDNTVIVFEALREIANNGTTVLMVTHENEAEKYADRIYRMDAGVLSD